MEALLLISVFSFTAVSSSLIFSVFYYFSSSLSSLLLLSCSLLSLRIHPNLSPPPFSMNLSARFNPSHFV